MYPIIEIPVAASETSEQVGTKFKFWYDEHSKMFKLGREGTGEHWSEKIVIAAEIPATLPPDELKIESVVGSEAGSSRGWKKVVLISTVLVTLTGLLFWVALHRRARVAAGNATEPSGHVRSAAIDAAARRPANFGELLRRIYAQPPDSTNTEALGAEANGRKSMETRDYASAITALKYAVSLDANFSRAWIELGWAYLMSADKTSALAAFQKAVEVDPKQVLPYKILAFEYMSLGDRDNAITTWQKVQGIAADDPDIAANLGGLYMAEKRYPEAESLLETAAKLYPSDAYVQLRLGTARLHSGKTNQGLETLHKALELDSGAEMLNDVAYEMAEADTNLAEALAYSQRSVKETEERSQKVDLENIQKVDLQLPFTIANYWDTLGWIYFKMNDLARAESYLNPAWQLGQEGAVGDHLGQVYEKEKESAAAVHMYSLALQANPRLEETAGRMRNLAQVPQPANRMSAGEELSWMRTVKLPAIVKETASAYFDVLFVPGGKLEKANFVGGSELLRHAGEEMEKTSFEEKFPPNSIAHLVRRGMLYCSDASCSFVFYPTSSLASVN